MTGVGPWIAVQPREKPAAILGKLPMKAGVMHRFKIPGTIVPSTATGILVFAWVGHQRRSRRRLVLARRRWRSRGWRELLLPPGGLLVRRRATNSQAFWLPMPADRIVQATLSGADLPGATNRAKWRSMATSRPDTSGPRP